MSCANKTGTFLLLCYCVLAIHHEFSVTYKKNNKAQRVVNKRAGF